MEISRAIEVIDTPDPRALQRYTLDSILYSGDTVSIFQGHENESRQRFIFYISKKLQRDLFRELIDLNISSKVIIYRLPQYEVIIETFFETNLNDYLNSLPNGTHLDENKVVQIFKGLFRNLEQFNQSPYGNICLNSIIFEKQTWKLGIAPAILNLYSNNKVFYPFKEKNQRTEVYALGVALFTCLFGFYPFSIKTPDLFKMKNYLQYMNQKSIQDCSKMVIFLKTKLHVSSEVIDILQRSLSITRPMTLFEFMQHPFFTHQRNIPITYTQFNSNDEIKILSQLQPKQVSKVLVALQKYKANPVPPKIQNLLLNNHDRNTDNVIDFLRNDQYLSRFQVNTGFKIIQPVYYTQNNFKYESQGLPMLKLRYFGREINDLDDEYPCRQLMKYLDQSRHSYGYDAERQALLLRYGYPYAVAFQLLKISPRQSSQIQQKIQTAVSLLLTVSNLNYQQYRPPITQLHPLQITNQSYQYIKPKYRQTIHYLYKHFLNTAIHKYNTAKQQLINNPNLSDAIMLKQQGLHLYRLCWKLLQASLLVRKQGKQLDLGHIQTSQRKQIQIGINNLLSKYFPNKIY